MPQARLGIKLRHPTWALLVVVLALLAAAVPGYAEEFRGKVVGITDGDTLSVLREGRAVTVRLQGIDAPEGRQPFGTRANQFASSLAFGQVVEVRVKGRDRRQRLLAAVILPDGRTSTTTWSAPASPGGSGGTPRTRR